MSGIGLRKGVGGPKTEEGKAKAAANLLQNRPAGAKRPRHGAYSVSIAPPEVQARVAEIEALIAGDMGGQIPRTFKTTAGLLGLTLVQIDRLNAHLLDLGPITKGGMVRPALETLTRLAKVALDLTNALGLTPQARNRMGLRDKPKSMSEQLEEARQALAEEGNH